MQSKPVLSMVIARETIMTATTQTVREIALEQPALVVDGKVKLYGRVPNVDELKSILA
jgi:hypothetical protein